MRYDHVHAHHAGVWVSGFCLPTGTLSFSTLALHSRLWSEERLTVLFDLAMAHLMIAKCCCQGSVCWSGPFLACASIRPGDSGSFLRRSRHHPESVARNATGGSCGRTTNPAGPPPTWTHAVSGPALVSACTASKPFASLRWSTSIFLLFERTTQSPSTPRNDCVGSAFASPCPDRRIATLLAFASTYLAVVHDDALDLFDILMRTTNSAATREGQQERLRTIHDLGRGSAGACPKPVTSSSMRHKIRSHCSSASTPLFQQSTCREP